MLTCTHCNTNYNVKAGSKAYTDLINSECVCGSGTLEHIETTGTSSTARGNGIDAAQTKTKAQTKKITNERGNNTMAKNTNVVSNEEIAARLDKTDNVLAQLMQMMQGGTTAQQTAEPAKRSRKAKEVTPKASNAIWTSPDGTKHIADSKLNIVQEIECRPYYKEGENTSHVLGYMKDGEFKILAWIPSKRALLLTK